MFIKNHENSLSAKRLSKYLELILQKYTLDLLIIEKHTKLLHSNNVPVLVLIKLT